MVYATPAARGVHAVELSADDAFHFERLAHALLDEALFEYDHFVTDDRRRVKDAQWRPWRQDDDIVVYRERRGSDGHSDTLVDDTAAPSARTTAFQADGPRARDSTARANATPRLLAIGTLTNSLDDVLYGVVTPTASAMRLRAAYTSKDDYLDSAVLSAIRAPAPSDPFRFLGLKWLLQRSHGGGLVRPRDFVYLESTGIQVRQDGSGQRVGFHIMHSVDLPQFVSMRVSARVQRGAFSTCYLYHELANGSVDVYMTAVVQPRGNLIASMAVRAAAAMLTTNWRALALFAENKKLAWLLETHRQLQATPTVSNVPALRCGLCTKSFKGLTRRNKKKLACQLCTMTVCTPCSMTRTLRSEGLSRDSVVATEMVFCKKCIALAGEESANEIARQQLWETEIVRTGRAHTQTALALARRDPTINGSRLFHQQHASLSMERGLVSNNGYQDDIRATWHEPESSRRHYRAGSERASIATTSFTAAPPSKLSPSGRNRGGTWNSSVRATETLSIGTLNYRTSSFQDATPSHRDSVSTTSSALVLLEPTRRMKTLDYLSKPANDETSSAVVPRASFASSSMYTEAQDFEVESVYSQTSSIPVMDAESTRPEPRMPKPLTIAEEEPVSEFEAFYLEQQQQQERERQQLQQHEQVMKWREEFEKPWKQRQQQQQPQSQRATTSMIPLETSRSSRVRFDEMEPRPSERSRSPNGSERLSYQMQLWLQMNELRDTAESTYQITQRNAQAMQNPKVLRFAAHPSSTPGLARKPPTPNRAPASARPTTPPRLKFSPMSTSRR